MSSNFPNGPDTIVNNVANNTPEMDTHPNVHNQLADAVMAVQTSLLPGGTMNLAAHVSASDPHPVYLTQVEGDARYALMGSGLTIPLSQHLTFSPDATYDIGALGATRPRTLYVGTSVVTPGWTNGTHLLANSDGNYDIGAPGASRPRFVYVASRVVTPTGASNNPSLQSGSHGVYAKDGNNFGIGVANIEVMTIAYTGAMTLFGTNPSLNGANVNSPLVNTALLAPAGNLLEQRNGTNLQTFNLYGTYTDASNYTRLKFTNNGGGIFQILSDNAGTGTAQALTIGVLGSNVINFITNGVLRWSIQNVNGTLQPSVDNTYNLGTPGLRVSNAYISNTWSQVFVSTNDWVRLEESNSGGRLLLTKQTAANVNPGANKAAIYLRDGTTGGTLKLVVRAGAAGAETTILDNIPQ